MTTPPTAPTASGTETLTVEERVRTGKLLIPTLHARIAELESQLLAARRGEEAARNLLFDTHPCLGKYGDDEERQCAICGIDFVRDDINDIGTRIMMRNLAALAAAQGET